MSPRELHLWTISSEEPSISNLYQERWLIDFSSVSQRIFCPSGFAVPDGNKDIAAVHNFLIPGLKRPHNRFAPEFRPVGEKQYIPDSGLLSSLKSERIDSPRTSRNDRSNFSAAQSMSPAEGTKVSILHHEVGDEVKFRN